MCIDLREHGYREGLQCVPRKIAEAFFDSENDVFELESSGDEDEASESSIDEHEESNVGSEMNKNETNAEQKEIDTIESNADQKDYDSEGKSDKNEVHHDSVAQPPKEIQKQQSAGNIALLCHIGKYIPMEYIFKITFSY